MCGIVGYVGKKREVLGLLIQGLEKLEYRGYDSAGIATIDHGKLLVEKQVGKLAALKNYLHGRRVESRVGIGHTRWATHGRPSAVNAHPHLDCQSRLAVVHNGIIENFQELKKILSQKGHHFVSETDTEVLAHLIEEEGKTGKISLEEAVRRALKKAKGAYAIGVLSALEPEKLIAARLGSPLVVGLSAEGNFIASDIPALLRHTKEVIFPNDGEMIVLTPNQVRVTTLSNAVVDHPRRRIEWDCDSVAKNGYETFMLKEIHEQPDIAEGILKRRLTKNNQINLDECAIQAAQLKKISRIFIVACGTAYHAGYFLKYFFEHLTSLPVEIDIASEFRYRKPKIPKNALVVAISQSGETADTLASLSAAKQKGCLILSLCNVMGSTMDRQSHGVIYTHAGPEIGVASTKAYTAQIISGILFALFFGRARREITPALERQILKELREVPHKMRQVLQDEKHIAAVARKYAQAKSALYLGRGFNFPGALEGALKNKEISYMHAEGAAAGEMKHGPIALIDSELPVFCICPRGDSYDKMVNNIMEVKARSGLIVAIASKGDTRISEIAQDVIGIPRIAESLSPLLVALPLQLLAYYIAKEKGRDIDQPRNLAKSVTVE